MIPIREVIVKQRKATKQPQSRRGCCFFSCDIVAMMLWTMMLLQLQSKAAADFLCPIHPNLRRGRSSNSGSSSNSNSNVQREALEVQDDHEGVTDETETKISTGSFTVFSATVAPQVLAAQWLAKDPFLTTYSEDRRQQRFALATLYYSTDGDRWTDNTGWLAYGEVNECDWFSSSKFWTASSLNSSTSTWRQQANDTMNEDGPCDEFGIYRDLSLHDNNLGGSLPEELSLLRGLQVIELSNNDISKTIPTSLESLSRLEYLNLAANMFTGLLPSKFSKNLHRLAVSYNSINGTVPTEFGSLTK